LFRSVVNMKFNSDKFEKKVGMVPVQLLQLARYRAMYLIGGWAYPGLDLTLRACCKSLQERVRNMAPISEADLSTLLNDVLSKDFLLDQEIVRMIGQREIPSMGDVVRIGGGRNAEPQFIRQLTLSDFPLDKMGLITNIAPKSWADLVEALSPGKAEEIEAFIRVKPDTRDPTNDPLAGDPNFKRSEREPTPIEVRRVNKVYNAVRKLIPPDADLMLWSKDDFNGKITSDQMVRLDKLGFAIARLVSNNTGAPMNFVQSFKWGGLLPQGNRLTAGNVLVNETPSHRLTLPEVIKAAVKSVEDKP